MFVNYFKNLALNYKNAAYAIPGDHSTSRKWTDNNNNITLALPSTTALYHCTLPRHYTSEHYHCTEAGHYTSTLTQY